MSTPDEVREGEPDHDLSEGSHAANHATGSTLQPPPNGTALSTAPALAAQPVAQAAGPSRPRHPFYTLPSELILDIVDLLSPESFINFTFANYPLLHSYGIAPALSPTRVIYITRETQIPALFPLLRMPAEIMLHIMRNLKPIDIMRFVFANYQDLARQGIAPPMTPGTERELWNAVRARIGRG